VLLQTRCTTAGVTCHLDRTQSGAPKVSLRLPKGPVEDGKRVAGGQGGDASGQGGDAGGQGAKCDASRLHSINCQYSSHHRCFCAFANIDMEVLAGIRIVRLEWATSLKRYLREPK
jgi:hypothetical protein